MAHSFHLVVLLTIGMVQERRTKRDSDSIQLQVPAYSSAMSFTPEFMWRKEFMVVPTKDLIENESNGTASILRVLKINKPDETQFPLQGRTTFGKDEPGLSEALGDQEPTLERSGC